MTQLKKLTLLKLGGSAITIKEKPFTPDKRAITRLSNEIKQAKVSPLILVHGGGSFGHPVAKQYQINEGYKDSSQIMGLFGDTQALGELMNVNQGLLSAVGVSNEPLEKLIYAARKAGALGAKLTGAGGGGCMIALCYEEKLKDVLEAVKHAGRTAFIARKTDEGVRIEH